MGLLFLIIAIFLGYILLKNNHTNFQNTETAVDILKKEYAKGAINKEEYQSKLKDIL